MAYWYHFAIMFEALFILTTIDTGTRVARFMLQEFVGRVYAPFGRADWLPGRRSRRSASSPAWGYFIWTGSIGTIWPMFGIANQLLAAVALAIGTTDAHQRRRGALRVGDAHPAGVRRDHDLSAGVLSIRDNFWPMTRLPDAASRFNGYLTSFLTAAMLVCVFTILIAAGAALARRDAARRDLDRNDFVPGEVSSRRPSRRSFVKKAEEVLDGPDCRP